MHLAGIFSAGTGLLLWLRWPSDTIAMLILSIIHGISAVVITGMLIILFYCHPGQRDIR
jgi:membrane-associated phospholipid phosphatase